MSTVLQRVERGLDAVDAGRPLVQLVDEVIRDYPDPYALATEKASGILLRRTGRAMDPRFVWWHQFEGTSVSSPRTFTGWQHAGPPSKSLRLPELVIERFDSGFQEASDELNLYGGFYRQGAHAPTFDERNEVPMLPSDVHDDLWALDFAAFYRQRITAFWAKHGRHFRTLAKVNVLGQAASALRTGRIVALDHSRLRAMVADDLPADGLPTPAMLARDSRHSPLQVCRYALHQDDRGCLYSLHAEDGRVILYLPWAEEALRAFESAQAMAQWLRAEFQVPQRLQLFIDASRIHDPESTRTAVGHLRTIADSRSEQAALTVLDFIKRPLDQEFFAYLASLASAEMQRQATLMVGNAELRKALWQGYLAAFLKVFGSFAPLGRPVLWIMLGVTVGKVALEVDAAVHAPDAQTRKAELRAAMIDTLLAALGLADLSFQASFDSLTFEVPEHESGASLADWQVQGAATLPVEGLESNGLLSGDVGEVGRLQGVLVQSNGSCWITLNGLSYRVRYSHDLGCWLIVPPDNPYAFGPLQPVRLNANGEWELLVPPRLTGGNPPPIEGVANVNSAFWDTYTRLDGLRSKRLAANALRRQKALLESWPIPAIEAERVPDLDEHGLDCVMVNGVPEYSYRHGQQYFNSLIEYYTSDESQVNDVFRHGQYRYGDEDSYIANLADSLQRLPDSNAVTLYRGGNAARGTGAGLYRSGQLQVGDVLINTDLTAFSENPYTGVEFATRTASQQAAGVARTFDDSSVIFQLPAGRYGGGTPISPFSLYWDEAETLFLPGQYFRVDKLEQVYGADYHFILITLSRTARPASGVVHDLRTGAVFDAQRYRERFRTPALAQRFFPAV